MGGTKIVVVQLKELIKTAIFALIGIVLIVMLIYFFLPRSSEGHETSMEVSTETSIEISKFVAGTYSSQILLHNTPVRVQVVVSETEIIAIELKDMAEVQEVFFPLVTPTFEVLSREIIAHQSTDIPLYSNALITSQILVEAVERALEEARIA